MQLTLITVGKLKDKFFVDASKEYEKRLSGFTKLNILEIDAAHLSQEPVNSEIDTALNAEAEKIIKAIPQGAAVITLCIEGKKLDSVEFSRMLDKIKLDGSGKICFIIGGSYGLSQKVKERSYYKLSMSDMTFPHRLARIMLLEQIYRAFKISEGSAYHK